MPTWSRSRTELLLMALIAMLAVWTLRARIENSFCLGLEVLTIVALVALGLKREWSLSKKYLIGAGLFVVPFLYSYIARQFFTPVAFELTAFAVFGSICLALVCLRTPRRLQAMSMVLGGFLVLFCASISDAHWFAVFPIAWVVVCVWHLIAQRWERLDLAMPEQITRGKGVRPATTLMFAGVLVITGIIAKDRLWGTQKATWGFMPTSGGSQWSDPGARGGVGTGEKAIAAKDHAESFGAVDSDVFLESTKSTLYDMFSDSLGPPKKKTVREKRQAIQNENMLESHHQNAESQKGGSAFSMERGAPAKHQHLEDSDLACVLQWDGPAGIRLGVEKFDDFDGSEWTPASLDNTPSDYLPSLLKKPVGENIWFMHPRAMQRLNVNPDRVSLGLIRIVDLQTHRIPTPMGTAGVHVKDIDQADFFGLEADGSFAMPGRKRIPPLTVIHVASLTPSEDEIRASLFASESDKDETLELEVPRELEAAVDQIKESGLESYDQLLAIVSYLRDGYRFDRSHGFTGEAILEDFCTHRRGGDHWFATAAAVMARQLGFRSRLATGFYVPTASGRSTDGNVTVGPDDVHVWPEVQLASGRWIELEPTPGYRAPVYRASFFLLCKQWVARYWQLTSAVLLTAVFMFLSRAYWLDWIFTVLWAFSGMMPATKRLRLGLKIIDWRAALAGYGRQKGQNQRVWLESLTASNQRLTVQAKQLLDAADHAFFGDQRPMLTSTDTAIVGRLRVPAIHQLHREKNS